MQTVLFKLSRYMSTPVHAYGPLVQKLRDCDVFLLIQKIIAATAHLMLTALLIERISQFHIVDSLCEVVTNILSSCVGLTG